jgi:hypothetical protein
MVNSDFVNPYGSTMVYTPSGGSDWQTIVFRYKEIGGILCRNIKEMVMFLYKDNLDKYSTFSPMFRMQYISDFFVAENFGLQNTTSS